MIRASTKPRWCTCTPLGQLRSVVWQTWIRENVLPAITAYHVMRVGRLPLITYFAPGDRDLADAVASASRAAKGVLLANHGPVIGGADLDTAVYAAEELEETAKLHMILRSLPTWFLTPNQQAELHRLFPS